MAKATKSKSQVQEDELDNTPFGKLLKEHFSKLPKVGDIISGKVVSVDSGEVRVDIGGVMVGVVRGPELFAESAEYGNLEPGAEVEATVVDSENELGEVELSFRSAGHQRVWDKMKKVMEDGLTITAKVLQANKGGLMMQVDAVVGFMPVSQLNPDNYPRVPGGEKGRILEKLRELSGKDMQVKVLDVNQREGKLIVSQKAVWEDEQKAVLDAYKVGDRVSGEISALTSFGAFVRFGEGVEGLVHISEIAWQRIEHPKDVLKVGDRVEAEIIDLNKSKIYLSMKRLQDDPWKSVKDRYQVGQVIEGVVHKIEPFGLMVKLDNQIHGLAHISEVSDQPLKDVADLEKIFKIGEKYRFEIVNIESTEHRLGLKKEGVKGRARPAKKPKKADKPATESDSGEASTN